MMNIDEKKKLALEVIARLKQAYPDAACSLDYNEACAAGGTVYGCPREYDRTQTI